MGGFSTIVTSACTGLHRKGRNRLAQYQAIPLDLEVWRSRLWELVFACAGGAADEQSARLREASLLFREIPKDCPISLPNLPNERKLESLAAVGAHESAAIALLGPDVGFMLSHGSNGTNLASIVLPGHDAEFSASARTPALALLQAQAMALLAETDHEREAEPNGKAERRSGRASANAKRIL